MKLSLWNIADHLKSKGFTITCNIKNGKAEINCVRFLTGDEKESHIAYIYEEKLNTLIANGEDFISVAGIEPEAIMNEAIEAFDQFNSWEYYLLEKAAEKYGLQEMINKTDEMVGNPILIHSPVGQVLAISKKFWPENDLLWAEIIKPEWVPKYRLDEMIKYDNLAKFYLNTNPKIYYSKVYKCRFIQCAVLIKPNSAVQVVINEVGRPFSDGIIPIVQTFVEAVSRHLKIFSSQYQKEGQLSSVITDLLEAENVPSPFLETALPHVNWSETDRFAVCVLSENSLAAPVTIDMICHTLTENIPSSFCLVYKSNLALLLTNLTHAGLDTGQLGEKIKEHIGQNLICSISLPFTGIRNIRSYFDHAMAAQKYALSDRIQICHANDYALNIIAEQLQNIPWLESLANPAVHTLKQYDVNSGTNFLETLRMFLRCGGSISATAKKLHIHRNTLIYRLDRIKEIIGTDIDDLDTREYLGVSYLIVDRKPA